MVGPANPNERSYFQNVKDAFIQVRDKRQIQTPEAIKAKLETDLKSAKVARDAKKRPIPTEYASELSSKSQITQKITNLRWQLLANAALSGVDRVKRLFEKKAAPEERTPSNPPLSEHTEEDSRTSHTESAPPLPHLPPEATLDVNQPRTTPRPQSSHTESPPPLPPLPQEGTLRVNQPRSDQGPQATTPLNRRPLPAIPSEQALVKEKVSEFISRYKEPLAIFTAIHNEKLDNPAFRNAYTNMMNSPGFENVKKFSQFSEFVIEDLAYVKSHPIIEKNRAEGSAVKALAQVFDRRAENAIKNAPPEKLLSVINQELLPVISEMQKLMNRL